MYPDLRAARDHQMAHVHAHPNLPGVAAMVDTSRLRALLGAVAALPGAHHTGTAWLDDELVWCLLEAYDPDWATRCVLSVYADQVGRGPSASRDPASDWHGQWVLALPTTLWQLCDWQQGSETAMVGTPEDGPGVPADPSVARAWSRTASVLWRTAPLDDCDPALAGDLLAEAGRLASASAGPAHLEQLLATVAALDGTLVGDAFEDATLVDTLLALAGDERAEQL